MNNKSIALAVAGIMLASQASSLFALKVTAVPTQMIPPVTVVNTGVTNGNTDDGDYIPPTNNNVTYTLDQSKIKIENSQLYKVNCITKDIGQEFGVSNFGSKVTAFEYKDGNLSVRVDSTSCSVSGWSNYVMPTDLTPTSSPGVTESQAISNARSFLKSFSFAKNLPSLGEPIVTNKNSEYPMMRDAGMSNSDTGSSSTDTGSTSSNSATKKYQYLTIVFPLIINKQAVYGQYGEPVGFTVSIDGKGEVTNFNGTMKFNLQKKRSDVLSNDSMISYIKKGGNNPYYGADISKKTTVNLDNISRGFIFFPIYRANTAENYISTGYILKSSSTKIPYSGNSYIQTNSDYYIGNNQIQTLEKQG